MATFLLFLSIYCLTTIKAQWGPYETSVFNYRNGVIAVYHGDNVLPGVDCSFRGYLRIEADNYYGYEHVKVTGGHCDRSYYYWKVSPQLKISNSPMTILFCQYGPCPDDDRLLRSDGQRVTNESEKGKYGNSIAVVAVLFVFLFGLFGGYVAYRRKRLQGAQRNNAELLETIVEENKPK